MQRRRIQKQYKKKLGQFFTPDNLSQIMRDWLNLTSGQSLLDPAIGHGSLIQNISKDINITGYDVDGKCIEISSQKFPHVMLHHQDFLEADACTYDAVIANPPYLKYNKFHTPEIIKEHMASIDMEYTRTLNCYIIFIMECLYRLKPGGRASFLVPSDWINSKTCQQFKAWLYNTGYIRYLVTFDEKKAVFNDNMSTACLILIEKTKGEHIEKNLLYSDTLTFKDILSAPNYIRKSQNPDFVRLSEFVEIKRGIATGANEFFARRKDASIPEECSVKCLLKAQDIIGDVASLQEWERANSPVLFLPGLAPDDCKEQINEGESKRYHTRYITSHRPIWYQITLPKIPDYFLTVFTRERFRFIRNECNLHSLTCFHYVYLKDHTLKEKFERLIHSDVFQECAQGHCKKYAGGLMKLEPRMAETMLVPDIRRDNF